jgi:hypothetical protein
MAPKSQAVARIENTADHLLTTLESTGALEQTSHLFEQFDQDDLFMPRLAWNMAKSGLKNPATGRRIPNDEFFDLRNEVSLGSELTGTILYVAKGYDFRKFDGARTIVHCNSVDRKEGFPRTELVKPDQPNGARSCATCPHKEASQHTREDGRTQYTPDCLETYEVLFASNETGEVYRMTLRGRSYRQFRPLVQKFFHVRLAGRLVNVPWYARQVTVRLVMADKADYAVANWEVGDVNPPDFIRWASGWVAERFTPEVAKSAA